jgi:hypothetical protein
MDTLHLSKLIEESWQKYKGAFSWNSATLGNQETPVAASYTKSVSRDSPDSFLLGVLTQCRGISEALARIIMAEVKTLESLMALSEDQIAAITDSKRKVGNAVAKRLYGLLHS